MNILISGASSGIGQQLALDYLAAGHRVTCCGRAQNRLASIARAYPNRASICVFDVVDLDACRTGLQDVTDLDLVVLNAGTCEYIDAKVFNARLFERVISTNLVGLANCLEVVIPKLQPGGQVALMGSSAGYVPLPRAEAYGASKAAVHYLARTLAITLRPLGIAVTYIAPGFVETPLTDRNDFPMPMKISTGEASRSIREGLTKRKSEIHFPRRFTGWLKLISRLPMVLQQSLIQKMVVNS